MNNAYHDHTFGQELQRPGEIRTWIVIALTGSMMVIEVAGGLVFGSMALLADGLHMASHAVALAINAVAYVYARRHAADARFSFGTGKVNALGGFTGAILLAGFALLMAYESVERIVNPVEIQFTNAIIVACMGLLTNGASVFILGVHNHDHDHGHNLRAAYFHVLADALTSFTAIFALLAGRYFDAVWLDPVMGIVGSLLVARWSIGPNIYNVNISVVSETPKSPTYYKALLPGHLGIVHSTVEVHAGDEKEV